MKKLALVFIFFVLISLVPTKVKASVNGVFDGVLPVANDFYISGWACDSTNYNEPLEVRIYASNYPIGGDCTTEFGGGTYCLYKQVVANSFGEDLVSANVCGGNGDHRFSVLVENTLKTTRSHNLIVQVKSLNGSLVTLSPTNVSYKSGAPYDGYFYEGDLNEDFVFNLYDVIWLIKDIFKPTS